MFCIYLYLTAINRLNTARTTAEPTPRPNITLLPSTTGYRRFKYDVFDPAVTGTRAVTCPAPYDIGRTRRIIQTPPESGLLPARAQRFYACTTTRFIVLQAVHENAKADRLFDLKYAEAVKYYNMVLKIEPDVIPVMVSMDMACRRAGGSDPVTQRFLETSGIDLLELYIWARMFADAKQFIRAIDALKTIAALYPGNHIILYDMGAMFYGYYSKNPSKKLLEEALECCEGSLEIKPDFIDATHDKILILSKLQRPMDIRCVRGNPGEKPE